MSGYFIDRSDSLAHHGIIGQKWGIRRYQNPDGSLTAAGAKRYGVDYRTGRMPESGMRLYEKDYAEESFRSGRDKIIAQAIKDKKRKMRTKDEKEFLKNYQKKAFQKVIANTAASVVTTTAIAALIGGVKQTQQNKRIDNMFNTHYGSKGFQIESNRGLSFFVGGLRQVMDTRMKYVIGGVGAATALGTYKKYALK